jgi:hypothetical protein
MIVNPLSWNRRFRDERVKNRRCGRSTGDSGRAVSFGTSQNMCPSGDRSL